VLQFLAFNAMLNCVLGWMLRTWCAWSKGQDIYPYFVAVQREVPRPYQSPRLFLQRLKPAKDHSSHPKRGVQNS